MQETTNSVGTQMGLMIACGVLLMGGIAAKVRQSKWFRVWQKSRRAEAARDREAGYEHPKYN